MRDGEQVVDQGMMNVRVETVSVLVCSSCYNRIASGFNHTHLFLMVLEPGESKIRVLADLVSGESPLHRVF